MGSASKKGPTNDINNYRPISILPVLSKILEKHIALHLKNHLEINNLLHASQSGFRANHSCETSLLNIIDEWLTSLNNKESVGTIFLDLSKAFDLVNHSILTQKLQLYNFSSLSLQWFSSYLSNRSQKVSINGHLSDSKPVLAGVPQGSVLGPILFIIYINDLPLHTQSDTSVDMFADDTTISSHSKSKTDVQSSLQSTLETISLWCNDNMMKINIPKTKAMYLTASSKTSQNLDAPPFILNGTEIEHSKC